MSWDVSLYKFDRIYASLDDMPNDQRPLPMGTLEQVQQAISGVFANTDWSDPIWGIFHSAVGSIEFNIGKDDPVISVGLHVRASETIVGAILQLCSRQQWQAIDISNGSFLDQSKSPEEGLRQWQAYRDQIAGLYET
jgi:hypothetical protein